MRWTLLLPPLAARFGPASTGLALAVALVWALHPLQTNSVTYIVQRAEALVGLFYLLTLYCFVRGATSARGSAWYAAAVAACALGMASKEVMVSAPLVALLYDRLFISGSFKEGLRRRWGWYLALAATWAILGLLVYLSLGRGGSAGFGLGMTAWEYARTQFGCIIHYLRLAFWPSPLVLDYGTGTVSEAADIVPYAIGVVLLLAATAVALARRPRWGFLGVWFFAILAPVRASCRWWDRRRQSTGCICRWRRWRRWSSWRPTRRWSGWGAASLRRARSRWSGCCRSLGLGDLPAE